MRHLQTHFLLSVSLLLCSLSDQAISEDVTKKANDEIGRMDGVVFSSDCSGKTSHRFTVASTSVKEGHVSSSGSLIFVHEILNDTKKALIFCQDEEVPVSDREGAAKHAKTRKVEVTVLENGVSQRIVLRPGGTLAAIGPMADLMIATGKYPTITDPSIIQFVPLTPDGEDITVTVTKSYEASWGTVYGPGKYVYQEGRLLLSLD